MNKPVTIKPQDHPEILLRSIQKKDLENLREWKNRNRLSFFYKKVISPPEQEKWFEGYSKRDHDCMFMVEFQGMAVGCMAFRILDNLVDFYNIILGDEALGKKGIMGKAMRTLISYAMSVSKLPMTVMVLKTNPAVEWYKKLGFAIVKENEEHFDFTMDPKFVPVKFRASAG